MPNWYCFSCQSRPVLYISIDGGFLGHTSKPAALCAYVLWMRALPVKLDPNEKGSSVFVLTQNVHSVLPFLCQRIGGHFRSPHHCCLYLAFWDSQPQSQACYSCMPSTDIQFSSLGPCDSLRLLLASWASRLGKGKLRSCPYEAPQ